MKKHLLFAILIISGLSLGAQTVISGWSFPVNNGLDSLNANTGLTGNLSYDLRYEGTDTTYSVIYLTDGATDYAAAAKKWDNGSDAKFWSVKFKAADYNDFKVSSKQFSSDAENGPRDFKLQWKISGGTFTDVPSGSINVSNNWTSGVLDNLPVPVTGQGTSSVYIRWIMSSNTSVNGGTVAATGESKIDDILVTAVSTLGTNDIVYSNRLSITPNPNQGRFKVLSTVPLQEARILDMNGKTISAAINPGSVLSIDLPGLSKGTYVLTVKFTDQESWYSRQILVN